MQIGIETAIPPIPPIEANMKRFPAGAVTIGVEFRVLDEQMLAQHIAATTSDPAERRGGVVDTSGISFHVFGDDGHEYLRFDCFADDPHYHYIRPGAAKQRVVGLDPAATGDTVDWALSCLRRRLDPMLREAGGRHIAAALDPARLASTLDRVEAAAREITGTA